MRLLAIVVVPALVLAVPSAGCAALGAKAPDPNRNAWERPVCKSGRGAVGVDAVLATTLTVGGIAVADESATAGALLFLVAGAYTISAVAAHGSAKKCQAAEEEYAAYQADEAAMGGLAAAPGAQQPQVAPPLLPAPVRPTPPALPPKPTPPPTPTKPSPPPVAEAYPETDEGESEAEADAQPAPDDSGNPWHAFWREVP